MKALDLFCGAGGAGRGLQLAGFHVTGIDNRPQPRYAGDCFIQDDAMAWLRGERGPLDEYDLIWASPPCQLYSVLTPQDYKADHPDLLPEVFEILRAGAKPYIVENVSGARHLFREPIVLCGSMFGLNIWRHRWFEMGNIDTFFLTPPCDHSFKPVLISGRGTFIEDGKRVKEPRKATKEKAIGIDWMTVKELDNAIPPAYSQFLGEQVLEVLQEVEQ